MQGASYPCKIDIHAIHMNYRASTSELIASAALLEE